MKCPVCDKENTSMLCPECGFDSSRDCGKYPTFGPVGRVPSTSGLRMQRWERGERAAQLPPKRPKLLPFLIAAAFVLTLGLGIWIGGGKPDPTVPGESVQMQESWMNNILRSDDIPDPDNDGYTRDEAKAYPVFGSDYRRDQIGSVTFLSTLANVSEDSWDVSENGNGAVMAWVEPNGAIFDLYIGAEGGIWSGTSCRNMFAGYENATSIVFGNTFHTDRAIDMDSMFIWCAALPELDLSRFNTSNVMDMRGMFYACETLAELNLRNFDTAEVRDFSFMFSWCENLTHLELYSFDTSNAQNMTAMFFHCFSLNDLGIGDLFVIPDTNTEDMFVNCPAGADYAHLVN